ncbi:hypothetical protein [Rodentibacter caecimuris]|uniref:Chalcone isomerase domain-containing protein n=1 Tax=Rodentibacter caecimuris TaxID=1796644 RepID=A0ABX3KVZ7_9PAST|nr:hypothetical protein BKG89_10300 [Rodentibacter heylii]
MKFKILLLSILGLLSTTLFAQWQSVGTADYNWGPFHVYSIRLYTESGRYQAGIRPLMFSVRYEKPIEGKNFAISLVKEINNLRKDDGSSEQWLKKMQQIFPDFTPKDILNYIVLEDKGYFVFNDTVLNHEFDREFNQAFINIWLSPQSSFSKLQPQLLGEGKQENIDNIPFNFSPAVKPLNEEDTMPELPPQYPLQDKVLDQS